MKLNYATARGDLRLEVEGDFKDCFEQLSEAMAILSNKTCGKCQSQEVHPEVRRPQDYVFYSLKCGSCGAQPMRWQ